MSIGQRLIPQRLGAIPVINGYCMKALSRSYIWWPELDQGIAKKVKGCKKCQVHQSTPVEAPLHPWEWPGAP